jgi:HEAT repeat protein
MWWIAVLAVLFSSIFVSFKVARSRGRNAFLWAIATCFIGPVGCLILWLLPPRIVETAPISPYAAPGAAAPTKALTRAEIYGVVVFLAAALLASVIADIWTNRTSYQIAKLRNGSTYDRYKAVLHLKGKPDPAAVSALIEALDAPESFIRSSASDALGETRDVRAVDPLISKMADSDSLVRWAAAKALGQIAEPRATPVLVGALNDKAVYVRSAAAKALGEIKDPRAVQPLMALMDEPSWDKKDDAINALAQIGGPAVEPWVKAALYGPDSDSAQKVLAKIGGPAVPLLISALKNDDASVVAAAAPTLGEIGDTRAVEPLIHTLSLGNWEDQKAAMVALGSMKDSRAIAALAPKLGDRNPDVRQVASEAFAKQGSYAVDYLSTCVKDPRSDVTLRDGSAAVLAKIDDQRAAAVLQELAQQRDFEIVAAGHEFFIRKAETGSKPTETLLVETLKETNDLHLAEALLNSKDFVLSNAASDWASAHGYHAECVGPGCLPRVVPLGPLPTPPKVRLP